MRGRRQKAEGRRRKVHAGLWLLLFVGLVVEVLGQDELPKLNPPLGEIPPSYWELHGNTVTGLCVVALLLVGLGVWLLLRPKPVVPVPPAVEARKALEALTNRPEDGAVLSRVSQVLRHYIQAAFELPPGELTTAEFCRQMEGQERIGNELSGTIAKFLHQCDDRKFAPTSQPELGAVAQARCLLEQVESRKSQCMAASEQVV